MGNIFHETILENVTGPENNDRNGRGSLLRRSHSCPADGDDDIGTEVRQFRRIAAKAIRIAGTVTNIQPQVPPFDPAELRHFSPE
jgi:hypothetical protein